MCIIRTQKNKSGFALIELIVAVLILALVMAGLIALLRSSMIIIANASEKDINLQHSQSAIERKISKGTVVTTPLTIRFSNNTQILVPGEFIHFAQGDAEIQIFLPRR